MFKIQVSTASRVDYAAQPRAIRSWFDSTQPIVAQAHFKPRDLAYEVLRDSADLFAWKPDLADLRDHAVLESAASRSVRFIQVFKDTPVDASEVVVNMYHDGRVYSIYNNYHYDIPQELEPNSVKVKSARAREIVVGLLNHYERHDVREPRLIVYQYHYVAPHPHKAGTQAAPQRDTFFERVGAASAAAAELPKEGQYFLVWEVIATTRHPTQSWRILVDAISGRIVNVIDLLSYASGAGRVYDPNPIVTSGNTALSSTTPLATLNGLTTAVVMARLNPPDGGGNLHLDGSFVNMAEIESPTFSEPVSGLGDFIFNANDRNFLAAMVYFHIDRFQNYIQSDLGLGNVANFSIPTDPQGFSGADNSRYDPVGKNLAFGEGGIPDASDAMVVLHEYGHAIQDNVNPGYGSGNYASGTSEGFGDFLAAVYYDDKHVSSATRGIMMSWDANTTDHTWPGRRYDVTWLFDGPEFAGADGHTRGQLWCATNFELYRKLGGDSQWYPAVKSAARDLTIRLHLIANFNVASSGATAGQVGQQIEAADGNLGGWNGLANGLHKKVIYDAYARRNLPGYPAKPVDVYINDGRGGGYGSTSGNDLFNEVLWQDNYWETQDIWVKPTAYAAPADQQAGGPGDHIEPPVGSVANLYARVKNRGTTVAGSGAVTVRAFHCNPGIGLVWPDDWTEMDASAAIATTNIVPGAGNGVIAGPFTWTPTEVGHECVLVIAECANDRANTQDLAASDHVEHSKLVPFDNNIAQRNLVPTAAKGKMKRGFWLRNPDPLVRTIALNFTSTLPKGWAWPTNLVNTSAIRMAPLERKWIDLEIDQAGGPEVTQFDKPYVLTVTGTIDGRLIGGMTYYLAPPSAFGKPHQPSGSEICEVGAGERFCLDIPWKDCEFEGELDLKIRFRSKK